MVEAHGSEVEKVLLYLGDARERARVAAEKIARADGEEHVVEALRMVERDLREMHRQLTQRTFYAQPDGVSRLAV